MARSRRQESPTGVYHWITRGINKKHLFHSKEDYRRFRDLLLEHKQPHGIEVYHYCFMPNHVHMLLRAPSIDEMGRFSHFVLRKYTYYYCKTHGWAGSVFQKGYKSLPVTKDSYLLECGRYIERNPVKAGLVQTPAQHLYSSFRFYAESQDDELVVPSAAFLGLSDNPDERARDYTEYVCQERVVDQMVGEALVGA